MRNSSKASGLIATGQQKMKTTDLIITEQNGGRERK